MKPLWSRLFIQAQKLMQESDKLRAAGLELRCTSLDSGGARCTADALPEHQHRYEVADLPFPWGPQ